jgi:ABC-type lipoprotein export system ATPase subunit
MSLLELEGVCKRSRSGGRSRLVLDDATLRIDAGELVAVWGLRGSGRTTLLRLATGIDAPDAGSVRFDGRDLAAHGEEILGREIGYCQNAFRGAPGEAAIEEVIVGLLVNGVSPSDARARAHEALARVDGGSLGARRLSELDCDERVRLAIAHALALEPRLLVIDEPVAGVELHRRDAILLLLRSLADEDGLAVLMSVGDLTGLSGADQAFTLGDGELRGSPKPELAPVLTLRPALGLQASG